MKLSTKSKEPFSPTTIKVIKYNIYNTDFEILSEIESALSNTFKVDGIYYNVVKKWT